MAAGPGSKPISTPALSTQRLSSAPPLLLAPVAGGSVTNWAERTVAIRSTAKGSCAPVSSMIRRTAHDPAVQLGAPPGRQERPQAGAVHERDAGHVEQEPGAVLAHGPQQSLLQRG